jgi:orotate phosphoribosyltransferase
VPIGAAHYASVSWKISRYELCEQVYGWVDNIGVLTYRKDVKAHGTRRVVEGTFKKDDRVMIIEDVVTTGGSVLQTAQVLF